MKELLKRSFFGLIYVLIVYFSLQYNQTKSLMLFVFMIFSLKEFSKLIKIHFNSALFPSIVIFVGFYLITNLLDIEIETLNFVISFIYVNILIGSFLITIYLFFIYFTFDKFSLEDISKIFLAIIYIAIPFSIAQLFKNHLLLSVFIIIWSSDTFAYLTGKYLGKHKLAEKISPKKTIEGVIGGMIGSVIVSYFLYQYFDFSSSFIMLKFMALSIIIVIFGTLGDLLESRFKRIANVKDSGNVMPGHGGFLDRLDSFIFAIPFVWAYISILQ